VNAGAVRSTTKRRVWKPLRLCAASRAAKSKRYSPFGAVVPTPNVSVSGTSGQLPIAVVGVVADVPSTRVAPPGNETDVTHTSAPDGFWRVMRARSAASSKPLSSVTLMRYEAIELNAPPRRMTALLGGVVITGATRSTPKVKFAVLAGLRTGVLRVFPSASVRVATAR
jgi:hypothetical protein